MEAIKSAARGFLRRVRMHDSARLFWWRGPPYNAGDWIGPYLFKAISGVHPKFGVPSNKSLRTVYITVGSLARWFCENTIVWGSGIIGPGEPRWQPLRTHAVRGPYTRERMRQMGFACPEVYGDPAILMPLFYTPNVVKNRDRIGVVPHYSNFAEAERIFFTRPEFKVIDIRQPPEHVINEIASCEWVFSSSLHGLILSHAYRIPAGWVEFSLPPGGDRTKFLDYFAGANLFSVPKPLLVTQTMPLDEIRDYVRGCPFPDLDPLISPLMESCPFIRLSRS